MDRRQIVTMVRAFTRSVQSSPGPQVGLLISLLTVVSVLIIWTTSTAAAAPAVAASSCTATSQRSAVINFFLHDDLAVRPTASSFIVVPGVSQPNGLSNTNLFGSIAVFDDSITEGVEVASKEIARGRGFYVFDYLQPGTTSLEFVWTAIFNNQSEYTEGSSITFKGSDNIDDVYREIAITGGTGDFRLARGWAGLYTSYQDAGAAILNTTCYVFYGCDFGLSQPMGSGSSQMSPSIVTMFSLAAICVFFLLNNLQSHRMSFGL